MSDLCAYELKVLRECAGQPQPDLQWGAAMSAALGFLKGAGYVTTVHADGVIKYVATDRGTQYLQSRDLLVVGRG
jgi:hypothetical protein